MRKHIFILEDDHEIGFILKFILFEEGYQVTVYETISSFRQALDSVVPDLLLMDVRVPDGDGMEFCAELKAAAGFRLPVLMMSADWHLRGERNCPADEYIAKPFELEQLVRTVGRYLDG